MTFVFILFLSYFENHTLKHKKSEVERWVVCGCLRDNVGLWKIESEHWVRHYVNQS